MFEREKINIVWLKRDLRLFDNEAVFGALQSDEKVLFLYVFEDLLINDGHYSERHWNFIKESLRDINLDLEKYQTGVLTVRGDAKDVFGKLLDRYEVKAVFSHQETGLGITFDRDKDIKIFFKNKGVKWIETINNGVRRKLKDRNLWFENWEYYMYLPLLPFQPNSRQLIDANSLDNLSFEKVNLSTPSDSPFQKGGRRLGIRYAQSFFNKRHKKYMFQISKPEGSRYNCSRLSPYIAWGNLSVREIFQEGKKLKQTVRDKRHISAFLSRLRWQAHFIQKFEMECEMEFASVNKAYHSLDKPLDNDLLEAWKQGRTGFPLVDAFMRALNETGYLNFRMRAMLVSFITHACWQPWQAITNHLAQQFLDFEPGIHFPQIQMQAGETGINNLRIYSPVKNALEHDKDAVFIRKWVPELADLPTGFVHEPWKMTMMDQQFNNFILGEDYPEPIIDIDKGRRYASDILFGMKKDASVQLEAVRILNKHTIDRRNRMLRDE